MRLTIKEKPKLKEGETRMVTKFLLIPKYINREWRWLESSTIVQNVVKFNESPIPNEEYFLGVYFKWVDVEWVSNATT